MILFSEQNKIVNSTIKRSNIFLWTLQFKCNISSLLWHHYCNIYHLISNKLDYSSSSKRSSSSSSIWLLLPFRRYYKKNRELKNINTKLAKKDMIANKGKLSEILLTKLDMLVMLHILSLLIPIASKEQTSPDLNFWLPKVVY